MATKKDSKNYQPQPKKGYPSSAAGMRKKEETDKSTARNTHRNPKDKTGTSYFGETAKGKPKTPGQKFPAGTPFKQRTEEPGKPKPNSVPAPKKPSTVSPSSPKKQSVIQSDKVSSSKKSMIKKK